MLFGKYSRERKIRRWNNGGNVNYARSVLLIIYNNASVGHTEGPSNSTKNENETI